MSVADVELVRGLYEQLDEHPERLVPALAPDVEYVNPADAVDPGTRSGRDGFLTAVQNMGEAFEEFSHVPSRFIDAGDSVVVAVTFRARGRGSGATVEHEEAHVWTLRDGVVTRLEWFRSLDDALAATAPPSPD